MVFGTHAGTHIKILIMTTHPFDALTPDSVLNAIDAIGLCTNARIYPLNSYENRVYYVGLENELPIIAKFYRPNRWNQAQILEEHTFTHMLKEYELPVISPLMLDGQSLFTAGDFYFALYPMQGGHAPELGDENTLLTIGRTLGRMHAISATSAFEVRKTLTVQEWGFENCEYLLSHNLIPSDMINAYRTLTDDILRRIESILTSAPFTPIRLHGDCHPGNILWRNDHVFLVDFDDCCTGPAVQDIWMLLSGEREERIQQLSIVMEGYQEFYDFNPIELHLIEALRTLRMIHYSAWLARRWSDPAFPMAFPWFNTPRYWANHILELREQLSELQEPPLPLY
jgi:Ser/Thr protein kinase RdoA (MazF antagonist)